MDGGTPDVTQPPIANLLALTQPRASRQPRLTRLSATDDAELSHIQLDPTVGRPAELSAGEVWQGTRPRTVRSVGSMRGYIFSNLAGPPTSPAGGRRTSPPMLAQL